MPLTDAQIQAIRGILIDSLRYKLQNYNPEPNNMPFHTRLLGSDRMALFSFIQSLNTNFGTTIFEPVAVELAKPFYQDVQKHVQVGDRISGEAQHEIQRIMDGLTTADVAPNKSEEIARIRAVCQKGGFTAVSLTLADLKVVTKMGEIYLFDLKTAKPNAGNFREFKRILLEWVAAILAQNPQAIVHTGIAIPYNPYEPKPYSRWTMRGMLDLNDELIVGKEFWDFLGREGAYEQLLDIFEMVGIELRPEIDKRFAQFSR